MHLSNLQFLTVLYLSIGQTDLNEILESLANIYLFLPFVLFTLLVLTEKMCSFFG